MNIYAVRDRLIDYYLHPFAATDDKNVLAAIAAAVNNQENMDAIAQAPHHFEVWKLAEIDEAGHVTEKRELLATCDSLIRTGVRQSANGPTEAGKRPVNGSQRPSEAISDARRAADQLSEKAAASDSGAR